MTVEMVNLDKKRVFWSRVLIAGILIVVLSIVMMVVLYFSGMNAARADAADLSDLDVEISELSARAGVISNAASWSLPVAFVGSLILNVSRCRLRKLRKLLNGQSKSSTLSR